MQWMINESNVLLQLINHHTIQLNYPDFIITLLTMIFQVDI